MGGVCSGFGGADGESLTVGLGVEVGGVGGCCGAFGGGFGAASFASEFLGDGWQHSFILSMRGDITIPHSINKKHGASTTQAMMSPTSISSDDEEEPDA